MARHGIALGRGRCHLGPASGASHHVWQPPWSPQWAVSRLTSTLYGGASSLVRECDCCVHALAVVTGCDHEQVWPPGRVRGGRGACLGDGDGLDAVPGCDSMLQGYDCRASRNTREPSYTLQLLSLEN